jgi:hypothetical protein
MKNQMMKKEEYGENIEEEIITLRVQTFKLSKNTEEREIFTSSIKKS